MLHFFFWHDPEKDSVLTQEHCLDKAENPGFYVFFFFFVIC